MKRARASLVQIAKQPRVPIDSSNDIKDNCPFSREIWDARRSTTKGRPEEGARIFGTGRERERSRNLIYLDIRGEICAIFRSPEPVNTGPSGSGRKTPWVKGAGSRASTRRQVFAAQRREKRGERASLGFGLDPAQRSIARRGDLLTWKPSISRYRLIQFSACR